MATEVVKLTRSENTPWGFRLSGGKDFGVILTVQKVNPGSIADKAGMKAGDAVTSINGQNTESLRHKEAQDAIIRGGNCLEIAIQKGGSASWKPGGKATTAQRAPAAGESVTAIVHSQYNSPAAMYSMNAIAETLSAHAEMIAPGVMGINFMKPEKPINTMSEVYKLVQEEEQMKGDRTPTPDPSQKQPYFRSLKQISAKSPTPPSIIPPVRQVRVSAPPVKTPPPVAPKPVLKPVAPPTAPAPSAAPSAPGVTPPQATCSDCGRYIAGIFVRLGDRTLHEECFRCSTCGTSLKNMGYVNINNKLYCEIHAKLAAKIIPPENVSPTPPAVNGAPVAPPAPAFTPAPPPPAFTPAPPPPAPAPAPAQVPPPLPMPPASAAPKVTQHTPSPFSPQVQHNLGADLGNLPHSPSSSGGLPFRSISPQPFRRAPGDYHKVLAPMSPPSTGGSTAPPSFPQSGPLPFEMTPYMPPEPAQSVFSSSSSQQITQVSQTSEQITQITKQETSSQSSHFSVDYRKVIAQQSGRTGTKFIWPPPKPGETPVLESNATPMPPTYRPPPNTQHINYSPLAMQSMPSSVSQTPSFRSVQPPVSAPPAPSVAPAPLPFVPPPLPSSFTKLAEPEPPKQEPPKLEPQATEAAPEQKETSKPEPPPPQPAPLPLPLPLPTSAPSGPAAPGFAPVLAPIVEPSSEPKPSAPQSGVPTGAGSRPAPKRGRGQLKEQTPGSRIPICSVCGSPIRGPFVTALGKTWCPDHFHCNNMHCKAPLQDIGFVEEQGQLYCENCYEAFLAPICNKCTSRIKGDCLNALDKQWHPECFICAYCSKPFGNTSFYLEDGLPYCEKDWNELFTTKCVGCGYPIEAGDRWVEALNNNYHSQCFKCSICNKNLEGQSFYAKGGRPFCKAHAR